MCAKILPFFCLFLYIVVATIGAFTGGLWGGIGIGGAIILFIAVWAMDKKIPMPSTAFALLTIVTLALFAAEIPLSSRVDISIHIWLQLTTIFVPLLFLTSPRLQAAAYTQNFTYIVTLALFVGAVALGCELASGGVLIHTIKKPGAGLTEYNRGIAHLVILAFPAFAGLWIGNHRKMALALALLLLFPASLTDSHTAKLALIVGAACTAAAFYRPIWTANALALFSVILVGFPFYAQKIFSADHDAVETWHASWRHRMEIWDYLSYRIAERPFFGWGLGTTHTLDFTQPHGALYSMAVTNAPHAHNFITELWVETGVIGLGCGLMFLLLSLCAAARLHATLRPFALGAFAAAVTTSLFGFDFWTDALWSAFALSAFALGMLQQQAERKPDLIDA